MATSKTLADFELGKKIGEMYVAAQGVSMVASDAACTAMDNANLPMRMGFNNVLSKSQYNVRAGQLDNSRY